MKKTIILKSYPPDGWTPAQWASAERVSERFNQLPVKPAQWCHFDGYIGRQFGGILGGIFIGIEKDGYAHS